MDATVRLGTFGTFCIFVFIKQAQVCYQLVQLALQKNKNNVQTNANATDATDLG